MARIKNPPSPRLRRAGKKDKKALKKLKPWMGNGMARARSLRRPIASRASKGSR